MSDGLGVHFKNEIRAVLLALRQTMLDAGPDAEYRRGYEAALVAVALAFNIPVGVVRGHCQEMLTDANRFGAGCGDKTREGVVGWTLR